MSTLRPATTSTPRPTTMARSLHSIVLACAIAIVVAPVRARASGHADAAIETASRNATAVAAVARAHELRAEGDLAEAVAQLDVASRLEPSWAEPARMRAEIFATLAERHHPSEAFNTARANELEQLSKMEPGAETDALRQEVARLRSDAKAAQTIEQRRRKLVTPAIILGSIALATLIGGILLRSMKPRPFLEPTAYRQYRRDRASLALLSMGGLLVIPSVVIGVLAGRQARNDRVTLAFEAETGRRHSIISFAPQFLRGGGGAGVHIRF